jgi:hypothetical protein
VHRQEKRRRWLSWYTLIISLLFLALFTSVVIKFLSQARVANDELIAEQVIKLQGIFKRINETCKITGFRHEKDYIDFLNVITFAGNVVGPMNLLEPKNWQGPYLDESLTIDGKEYQIVTTKAGYYIVPGDGVKLSNGKIIGKTLTILPTSNIERMMRDSQALMSNNRSLGARIDTYQDASKELPQRDFVGEEIETEG